MFGIVSYQQALIVDIEDVRDSRSNPALDRAYPGMNSLVNGLIDGKVIAANGRYIISVDVINDSRDSATVTVMKLD